MSLYWKAIERGICNKNHLDEANLSEKWLDAFEARLIELFPEVEDEPVVALSFELHVLGDAHRHANKECKCLEEESRPCI
ncbi:hypothetical protein VCR4J5_670019 [Vibrio crassostreae]|uniref:Uncharacterized protein n=1 Tax=Vibrio crassostreae TaxID=246167 RepID=A0ABP1WYQ4_9VIBR|nr:hypothetical protein VCR4J5_670019 [Vibrio crassostreae]